VNCVAEKDNLGNALKLARAGFHLFPCAGKKPLVKWKELSTRDEAQIRKWWEKTPGRVAAFDLGKSGHIVIDCDVKGEYEDLNGKEAFEQLCDNRGFNRAEVPVVATPSGGIHYYFRQREGERRGDAKGALPQGIDVKGSGYVIAPCMVFPDGGEYEYQGKIEDLINAPVLPDWLADVLGKYKEREEKTSPLPQHTPISAYPSSPHTGQCAKAYINKAIDGEFTILVNAPGGNRNQTLYNVSLNIGIMVESGWLDKNQAQEQLFTTALQKGLLKDEIKRAITNGFRNAQGKWRKVPDHIVQADEAEIVTPQEMKLREEISNVIYLSFEKKRREREGIRTIVETQDGTLIDEDTGELVELEAENEPVQELRQLDYPQGLVGEIARWIVSTARYPQPELAIGAALGIVGTVAGRQFASPTMSGTHLYTLAMADTGTGKDAPLQAVKTILNCAKMSEHLGPDEFASAQAVVKFIRKKPLSICPMDEFGGFMKRVMSRRGSTHENAIPKILRSMWSSSFATYMTPEAASYESVAIHSPSISIFGATTPEQFYGTMSGAQVEDGTLNRFLLIRGRDDVEEVEPEQSARHVPQSIIDGLKRIYNASGETAALWRNDAQADPTQEDRLIELAWCADGVQEHYKAFAREIAALRKKNAHYKEFFVRTAEMALRIATIIAIGCGRDNVRREDLDYGIKIARTSADFMVEGARDYMAENDNQANMQKIIRILKAAGGRMSRNALVRKLHGSIKPRDLSDLIRGLAEAEVMEIQEIKQEGAGRPTICYQLKK